MSSQATQRVQVEAALFDEPHRSSRDNEASPTGDVELRRPLFVPDKSPKLHHDSPGRSLALLGGVQSHREDQRNESPSSDIIMEHGLAGRGLRPEDDVFATHVVVNDQDVGSPSSSDSIGIIKADPESEQLQNQAENAGRNRTSDFLSYYSAGQRLTSLPPYYFAPNLSRLRPGQSSDLSDLKRLLPPSNSSSSNSRSLDSALYGSVKQNTEESERNASTSRPGAWNQFTPQFYPPAVTVAHVVPSAYLTPGSSAFPGAKGSNAQSLSSPNPGNEEEPVILRNACEQCFKSKAACDFMKPCSRCVHRGLQKECTERKTVVRHFGKPPASKSCVRCRKSRTRCDNARPCHNCARRSMDCVDFEESS